MPEATVDDLSVQQETLKLPVSDNKVTFDSKIESRGEYTYDNQFHPNYHHSRQNDHNAIRERCICYFCT